MQYYVDRVVSTKTKELMIQNASIFHLKCKEILSKIGSKDIENIRKLLA